MTAPGAPWARSFVIPVLVFEAAQLILNFYYRHVRYTSLNPVVIPRSLPSLLNGNFHNGSAQLELNFYYHHFRYTSLNPVVIS